MWILFGWLLLIVSLRFMDRRYRHLQQAAPGGAVQALAIGKRAQPLWWVWGGVSGAAIAGFSGSRSLGLDGMPGAFVAALVTFLYFERMQYPKLLLTTGPQGTRVAFETLRTITIDLDDKSQLLFDGRHLELRAEGSQKQVVLSCQDFPAVDFPALWRWLADRQRNGTASAQEPVAAIGGFRAVEGISDLLFPRESQSSRRLLLPFWVGLLIFAMKRIFG